MGVFGKMFGRQKTIASVLTTTQNNIFNLYGVSHPTDAQKMKASFYLCISGIAILNDLGAGIVQNAIDALLNETRKLTKQYSMSINDLSNNDKQLIKIIEDFPKGSQVTLTTRVNGLAAFEALYFALGKELMNDILTHKGGPMGAQGYAAIVVVDGIFGEGKSKENFNDAAMELLEFTNELIQVI